LRLKAAANAPWKILKAREKGGRVNGTPVRCQNHAKKMFGMKTRVGEGPRQKRRNPERPGRGDFVEVVASQNESNVKVSPRKGNTEKDLQKLMRPR